MAITVQVQGQRIYLTGDTFPVKDDIKAMGGHWDGDRKAWWVGVAKREAAEQLASSSVSQTAKSTKSDAPSRDARVKSRVTYKAKDYYVLAGSEREGKPRYLLAARNGAFQFWADGTACVLVKHYGHEDYRSGRMEYPTLGYLMKASEKWAKMTASEREDAKDDAEARARGERCPCSGGACRCGSDSPCCMCW